MTDPTLNEGILPKEGGGHRAAPQEDGLVVTRARSAMAVKATLAISLTAALFLSAVDIYLGLVLAAAFIAATIILDYWVYRSADHRSAGRPEHGGALHYGASGGSSPLVHLLDTLMSGSGGGQGVELDEVRADLSRIGDLNNQLTRLGDIARELNAALPYEETKVKILRLSRRLLNADVVALVSEEGGGFALEGVDGCESAEIDVDCCAYYSRCPVRSTFRSQAYVGVPDHACSMFPSTLRSQLSVPFATADGERTIALIAAAARTHAFDEVSPVVLERLALNVHAALSAALKYDRIRREVVTDPLTNLYNRRFFEQRAREEIERSIRDNTPVSLLMLDIDHFKLVNDGYGHQTGDRVLQSVARHLKECVRETDLCARYGGEEFVLLLPDTPGGNAMHMADRLRKDLAQLMHTGLGLPFHVSVTVSGGVATCPRDATDVGELIRRADEALCEAKSGGRNRIERAILNAARPTAQRPAGPPRLEVVPAPEHDGTHR